MSTDPFLGEIAWVSFNFPPRNWALCNGQSLPLNQNQPLFSLLGTTYGGDGRTYFNLPDLRGRTPIGMSHQQAPFRAMGERGGEEAHTLTLAELPTHTHGYSVSDHRGSTGDPGQTSNATAFASGERAYTAPALVWGSFHPNAVQPVGSGQPHTNMQPYLTLTAIISLAGVFPTFS